MFLLSQLKHGVVISAPTALKGKFGKGRRASRLRFTLLEHLWCHLESLSVDPGRRKQSWKDPWSKAAAGTHTGAAGTAQPSQCERSRKNRGTSSY